MSKINIGRVVLGGLVAGVIFNVGEGILNLAVLAGEWEAVMQAAGLEESGSAMVFYIIWGFVMGIALVWLYAAIRPRFGPGPKTALIAGLTVWFFVWLIGLASSLISGMFPVKLVVISVVWGLVEVPIAALVGAWLYREEEASPVAG